VKLVKILAYGVGGIVVLAMLALGLAAWVVDGAFVKARLEQAMKERQRTLAIEGEPKVKFFPVAGISVGKVILTEPSSDTVFVALDAAEIAVRTMPLFSGEAAIEALKLSGLKLNLVRGRDGRMNFADLAGAGTDAGREARSDGREERPERHAPRLRVAEVGIDRAQISYRDEATGQEINVGEFTLKTGRLDGDVPGTVSYSAHLTGRRPDLDIRAQAAGAVRFNLSRQEIGLDAFSFKVKGRAARDTLALEITAPKVDITPSRATGSAISASVQLNGPKRNLDAKLSVAAVEGSASALSIPSLALELDASLEGRAVKGSLGTPLQANLAGRAIELPKIVANFMLSGEGLPAQGVSVSMTAAVKADLGRQTAAGELSARIEQSNLQAKFAATRLEPLAANFELTADRLDLDRYLPAKRESTKAEAQGGSRKGEDRIDLSGIKGPKVSGKLAIGALTVQRVKLADVKAEVKLAGGRLEVAPYGASLYGGTLSGSLGVEANGNRITLRQTMQGVQVGPLLRDAAEQDRFEGRGNVSLDVAMAGASVSAMKKSLGGTARVELRDGAVKGINVGEAIQDVRSVLGSKSATANDPTKRTGFSEITASFAIKNGVAHNQDLQGKAPLLRLTGGGDVDVGNSTVNYLARVAVVATSKGQGGRDLSNLAGVTLPVKVTGALEKPAVSIDFAELAAKSGVGLVKSLGGGKLPSGDVKESVKERVGERLRGLFGR